MPRTRFEEIQCPVAQAAAAIGVIAEPSDEEAITALRNATSVVGIESRELTWNAAVALARLGDPGGSRFVADTLLDRSALAKLITGGEGEAAAEPMSLGTQDRVMLATMASAPGMTDPVVWAKIRELAEDDPSVAIRKVARELLTKYDPTRTTDGEGQ